MFEQTIYGLVDSASPETIRYVGRTNTPGTRLRFHAFNPFDQDGSPRGLWAGYVSYAGRSIEMVILETQTFEDSEEGCKWAKRQERHWIKLYRQTSDQTLNRECWWTHPDRKIVPKGVRAAWERLHTSLFWLDYAAVQAGETLAVIDEMWGQISLQRPATNGIEVRSMLRANEIAADYQRGRHGLVDAIKGLSSAYPSIVVAPVEWIEHRPEKKWCFDGWELRSSR